VIVTILLAWTAASLGFIAGAWWRAIHEEEQQPETRQKGK
jgi:hypothetical protein